MTYDNLRELTVLDMCIDESMRITPALFRYDEIHNIYLKYSLCLHVMVDGV